MSNISFADVVEAMETLRRRGFDPDTLYAGEEVVDTLKEDAPERAQSDRQLGTTGGIDVLKAPDYGPDEVVLVDSTHRHYPKSRVKIS